MVIQGEVSKVVEIFPKRDLCTEIKCEILTNLKPDLSLDKPFSIGLVLFSDFCHYSTVSPPRW